MNYERNNLIIALFVGLAFLFLVVIAFFSKRGPLPITPGEKAKTDPVFGEIYAPPIGSLGEFSLPQSKLENKISAEKIRALPESAPVYAFIPVELINPEKMVLVAETLGLSPLYERIPDDIFLWEDTERNLVYDQTKQMFTYSLLQLPETGLAPSKEMAIEVARDFLAKTGLNFEDLKLSQERASPVYIDHHGVEETPHPDFGYNAVRIPVVRDLSLGVVSKPDDENLIEFIVGANGQIINIKFIYHKLSLSKKGVYKLKDFEKAWQEVLAGRAQFVDFGEDTADMLFEKLGVEGVRILSVEVSFFEPRDKQLYLQPIYVLTGSVTLSDGRVTEVTLYLPAIDGLQKNFIENW